MLIYGINGANSAINVHKLGLISGNLNAFGGLFSAEQALYRPLCRAFYAQNLAHKGTFWC